MNSRTVLNVPYQISRTPLTLIDTHLVARFPQDSPPRLVFDRALGSYDVLAGRLLDNSELKQSGEDRVARTHKIVNAKALEAEATERREAAETIAAAAERQADETEQRAHDTLVDGLQSADAAERTGKQAAEARARDAAAARKRDAEEKTSRRLDAVDQKVDRVEAVADTRANAAQKTAKAKFDDAADERAKAADKRADADQLSKLTAEKRKARAKS